ncbi:MAG: heavy metal translocating P-type ATPase [Nitrospirae bacterium]|nr:heavy metal translocating P-type ATPase [Nitrospirota bacterium]
MYKCDHCLRTFAPRDAVHLEIDGAPKVFCCGGCSGIYLLIHSEGLDNFYSNRRWSETGIDTLLFEKEIDPGPFEAQASDDGAYKQTDILIDGIRCASCVWLNEKVLSRTPGIMKVNVNYATHRARVSWDPAVTGIGAVLKKIQSIGYMPKPFSRSGQLKLRETESREMLVKLGTAGFLSSQLMIYSIALYAGYFQGMDRTTKTILEVIAMFLTAPVIFYSGGGFIKSTLTGLRHFRFNMDSLITIGTLSAFFYSIYAMTKGAEVYFDTSAMIVTLILLGRYIELSAKGKASEAIDRLTDLAPAEARLIVSGKGMETERLRVPLASLKKGDLVEVAPGERVPIDGVVVGGSSEADESIITGESRPVPKGRGSKVIGGSINLYGSIKLEVTATGEETILSGIIRSVEEAQSAKPRIQGVADRVVGMFVPSMLILAVITGLYHMASGQSAERSLMTGVAVLVIACPCSLGLATPLAVLIFTGMASSAGVLIRRGDAVEKAGKCTDVLFDKTGTLTQGRPSLRETMVMDPDFERDYLISLAASLERLSEHSIGNAVLKAESLLEKARNFEVTGFAAVPGRGIFGRADGKDVFIGNRLMMNENGIAMPLNISDITGGPEREGETVVFMGWRGKLRAVMAVSDILRDESAEAAAQLHKMGLGISVISGDNESTTRSIASKASIGTSIHEATPEMKRTRILEMQKEGKIVMMVGDGINDAPGLTQSDIGVAMGRGTDIAIESADAVMLRNDLRLVPFLIGLSKKTYAIIRQNIFWAFIYNLLAIPVAAAGLLHPVIAAGAMAASSLFVVGNSLRIRNFRQAGQ